MQYKLQYLPADKDEKRTRSYSNIKGCNIGKNSSDDLIKVIKNGNFENVLGTMLNPQT